MPTPQEVALASVADEFVAAGYRIERQTPTQVVIASGKPVNHILHLLISVFTLGLWLPVWLVLGLSGGVRYRVLSVDGDGEIVVGKPTR